MQQTRHHVLTWSNQFHLITAQDKVVGEFAADQARTEHKHALLTSGGGTKARIVFQVIDRENRVICIASNWHANHLGT